VAFTVDDYRDLIELLREHPEWKSELRREFLDEQFMQLPALVRQNSADIQELKAVVAQNSADIAQNSADIRALKDVVARNSAAIEALTTAIAEMRKANDDRFKAIDARFDGMDARFDAMDTRFDGIDARLVRVDTNLGDLNGAALEAFYRSHPASLAPGRLRKVHVVEVTDLVDLVDAVDDGLISESQSRGLANLDLVLAGREGRGDEARDAWLAVEVSVTVDDHDVTRAAERAATLRSVGFNAYAAVAGNTITPPTMRLAEELGVEVYERNSA
jgi:hypothetical protein